MLKCFKMIEMNFLIENYSTLASISENLQSMEFSTVKSSTNGSILIAKLAIK